MVKNPPANAGDSGDVGLIPKSGRSPGEGNGKPFQYSCLGNPMDRGATRIYTHTQHNTHTHTHTHTHRLLGNKIIR